MIAGEILLLVLLKAIFLTGDKIDLIISVLGVCVEQLLSSDTVTYEQNKMQVFPGDSINVASTSASAVNGIHYSPQTGSISTRAGVLHGVGSRGADAMDVDGASGSGSKSDKDKFTVAVPEQRRVGEHRRIGFANLGPIVPG